jgi:hypothetical protein
MGEAAATPPGFYPNWGFPGDKVSGELFVVFHQTSRSHRFPLIVFEQYCSNWSRELVARLHGERV